MVDEDEWIKEELIKILKTDLVFQAIKDTLVTIYPYAIATDILRRYYVIL